MKVLLSLIIAFSASCITQAQKPHIRIYNHQHELLSAGKFQRTGSEYLIISNGGIEDSIVFNEIAYIRKGRSASHKILVCSLTGLIVGSLASSGTMNDGSGDALLGGAGIGLTAGVIIGGLMIALSPNKPIHVNGNPAIINDLLKPPSDDKHYNNYHEQYRIRKYQPY